MLLIYIRFWKKELSPESLEAVFVESIGDLAARVCILSIIQSVYTIDFRIYSNTWESPIFRATL